MASTMINPVKTGEGRIFINPYNFGGASKFNFHNFMKIEGLDKTLGDIEPIYYPDPNKYDEFIENGFIKGSESRWSSSLSGKLPIDTYSTLELLASNVCEFTLQVHYGRCTKPDNFQDFESAIVLKGVRLTSYGLSPLTALNPGERALIDENASITASTMYRLFNQKFVTLTPQTSGRVLRIAHADLRGCENLCSGFKDGNKIWIALIDETASAFAVTTDGGLTWTQFNSGSIVHSYTGWESILHASAGKVYWTSTATGPLTTIYSTDLDGIIQAVTPTPYEILEAGDFVPTDVASTENYVYISGHESSEFNGTLYRIDKATQEIDAMYTNNDGITAISFIDDDNSIIGLRNGEILVSVAQGYYSLVGTINGSGSKVTAIKMFDSLRWAAANDSNIYVTNDAGVTWTRTLQVSNIPSAGLITNFTWYDNLVGYAQSGSALLRTIDSGTTWKVVNTGIVADESQNIVVSPYNPNLFMAVRNLNATSSYVVKGFV